MSPSAEIRTRSVPSSSRPITASPADLRSDTPPGAAIWLNVAKLVLRHRAPFPSATYSADVPANAIEVYPENQSSAGSARTANGRFVATTSGSKISDHVTPPSVLTVRPMTSSLRGDGSGFATSTAMFEPAAASTLVHDPPSAASLRYCHRSPSYRPIVSLSGPSSLSTRIHRAPSAVKTP